MGKELKQQEQSPSELISLAVEKGADLDKLEKLLSLKERYEANEARKAYHQAMSDFKKNPPKIDKDKKVAYKEVRYAHASLANVCEKINSALSEHGLSASWNTKQDNGTVTVTCKITHAKGHSEETSLTAAPDNTGSKNAIQAIGSTIAYLERYSLLSLTGLATHDQDNDAVGQDSTVDKEQATAIRKGIKELGGNVNAKEAKLLKYLKADSIEEIAKADFQKAMTAIEATPKAVKKAPKKASDVEEKQQEKPKPGSKESLQEIRASVIKEGEKQGCQPGDTIEKIEKHFQKSYWELESPELLDALNLMQQEQL